MSNSNLNNSSNTAFIRALENEGVHCQVVEIDYQRSFSAFGAVDTHYIIQVRATAECDARCRFKTFNIEKSFHNFRNLVTAFKKASKDARAGGWKDVPESTQNLIAFSDAVSHVIDSEPISHFIGKMTFSSVQELAQERRNTIDKALRVLTENYPASAADSRQAELKPMREFKKLVNDFFLTDHVYEEDSDSDEKDKGMAADAAVASLTSSTRSPSTASPTLSESSKRRKNKKLAKLKVEKVNMNTSPASVATEKAPTVSEKAEDQIKSQVQFVEPPMMINTDVKTPVKEALQPNSPSPVRPKSMKKRMSTRSRARAHEELSYSNGLSFHDNAPIVEKEKSIFDSPKSVAMTLVGLTGFFLWLPPTKITLQLDLIVVASFAFVAFGMSIAPQSTSDNYETAEPIYVSSNRKRSDSETLIRKSIGDDQHKAIRKRTVERQQTLLETFKTSAASAASTLSRSSKPLDKFEETGGSSPIKKFPEEAQIGSMFNCWSEPICSEFKVRGRNYLRDKVKVASGPFLFPALGVDVFLSDCCPEHIARYKAVLGGKLREKPTFIINYRLPWGNCVTYSDIPSKFLPFLRHRYDKSSPVPSMQGMTNPEVCASRYLMASDKEKDQILKIVPKVVKGPWIVKKTCDGKPAIVCNKMPTQYFYEPASEGKAEYLEIDLDIVASSAARAILSVAQRYTKTLTLDLGFVIQGNAADELPEQMVFGSRLHGLDPLTAPMLPHSIDQSL